MTTIAEAYAAKKASKPPLQRLDPEFLLELARVCGFGDAKHADTHWTEGLPWSEVMGAVKRHIAEIELGNLVDAESGLPHAAHAATGLMFLHHYMKHQERYGHLNDLRFFPGSSGYNSGVKPPPVAPLMSTTVRMVASEEIRKDTIVAVGPDGKIVAAATNVGEDPCHTNNPE